jgi:streptogramin lyase
MAGSLPISGSSVQLYAAGSTGNGSTATTLGPAVITDATGLFTITAAYTCPDNRSLLYVVASGGNAGTKGATNAGIALLATFGACSSVTGDPNFVVNEATTVASTYAMAQFLSAGGNIGASSTNFGGLLLAFGTDANLVNIATGQAPGPNFPNTPGVTPGSTPPTATLNALANALNACIVATDASGPACTKLYSATAVSGTKPSNTLDALVNLARHPANNAGDVFALTSASTAFTPAVTTAPSDWTMFATYAGGGMNEPAALGIDSAGNIRVANYFYKASYFTNTGTPTFADGITDGNLNNSYGLAVDANDNVWMSSEQGNGKPDSISVFNSSGQSLSGTTGILQGGLNFPQGIAIDRATNVWVVDSGNAHLTLLSQQGAPLSGATGYTANSFEFPVAVAVDSKGYGFVANQGSNTITRVKPDGSEFVSFVVGGGPSGVAVDASDNVWVANYQDSSVGLLSSDAKVISSGYRGGALAGPQGIAIDGEGNVWVANFRGPTLTKLAGVSTGTPGTLLSPAAGYGPDAKLLEAYAIAIDASGNVWVTNFGSNTLTEFIGLAAPVRTPLIGPVALP